mmetsp:Transcript_42234/g.57642  ORF Transcript_42234/g.57642 Transcript_42234/m.57642 type:complete len:114 (+) Transcript_42234:231-572(+)
MPILSCSGVRIMKYTCGLYNAEMHSSVNTPPIATAKHQHSPLIPKGATDTLRFTVELQAAGTVACPVRLPGLGPEDQNVPLPPRHRQHLVEVPPSVNNCSAESMAIQELVTVR